MSGKLTDIFNTPESGCALALRLQQVLDQLPEKLSRMAAEHPRKDILLVQVPIDRKSDPAATEDQRAAETEAVMARAGRVAQAFEKELIEKFPQVNCILNASSSVWGDHLAISIVTSAPSVAARLQQAGEDSQNIRDAFEALRTVLGEKDLREYVFLHQALQMIHHGVMQARVGGSDPDKMGPLAFDGFGPDPAAYHGRYAFWDVDAAWPKPALLPEFRHIFDQKKDRSPKL